MSASDHTTIPAGYKRCSKCGVIKPATTDYFYPRKERKSGLRSHCRECNKAYEQSPLRKAAVREHQRKPERRAYLKSYQQLSKYRDNHNAHAKIYRLTPKGRSVGLATIHRRRARKNASPHVFAARDWQQALSYFDHRCAVCGRLSGLWHVIAADHWIPLSDPNCPGTIPSNIIPLCHGIGGCNNSKSDRDPIKWLTERYGIRKAKQILKRIQAYFDSLKDKGHADD